MPVYCYRRVDNGKIEDVFMSSDEMQRKQDRDGTITLDDGSVGIRDFSAEVGKPVPCAKLDPVTGTFSEALAVDPSQIPEAIERAKRMGVPTDFDRLGRPEWRGYRHRRAYLQRVEGVVDKSSWY